MKRAQFLTVLSFLLIGALMVPGTWGCGSSTSDSGGGSDATAGTGGTGDAGSGGSSGSGGTTASTVTLSGQALATSGMVGLRLPSNSQSALGTAKFQTSGDTPLTSAEVVLVKITADDTETEVATTTTDSSGNYSFADVPVAVGGTGAATDYYYEVRVTSGNLEIKAPVAPEGNETVNVTPESDLAAKVISDVAQCPACGDQERKIPLADTFTEVRNLVSEDVYGLRDSVSYTDDLSVNMANGVVTTGGDAEKVYKKFQFESESVFTATEDATTDDAASYLARVAKEGCAESESSSIALPQVAAEVMADALTSGTTFTPQEIVEAVNGISDTSVDVNAKVTEYAEKLSSIEEAESQTALVMKLGVDGASESVVDEDNLAAFYTKRDLAAADFTSTVELTADQAVSFLETLGNQSCNLSNISQVIGQLTGSAALQSPKIEQAVIYNDSGFGCNGAGQGHFRANVDVYQPPNTPQTITSVVITSTDGTALGGDGSVTLTQNGPGSSRYVAQADGDCVTIDREVTYTITATLSDNTTATDTVVRTHPQTMESIISMNGQQMPNGQLAVATDMRPLISWTSPEEIMADYAVTPAAGSQVKYTYELSYYRLNGSQPDSQQDTALSRECPMPGNSSSLYATSSMIPVADCDVATCATAAGTTADKIYCRINIQTYLFDPYDQQMSQAAGAFRQFCVDTNSDGDCGS